MYFVTLSLIDQAADYYSIVSLFSSAFASLPFQPLPPNLCVTLSLKAMKPESPNEDRGIYEQGCQIARQPS